MNARIKCSNFESKKYNDYRFLSYFYLHGKAELENGFDCCEGNIEAFAKALSMTTRIVTIEMENGEEILGLMLPSFRHDRPYGLICFCSDVEGIKSALDYPDLKPRLDMYEDEITLLKDKYPETYSLIKNYRRNG